jgi:hypothetical protein
MMMMMMSQASPSTAAYKYHNTQPHSCHQQETRVPEAGTWEETQWCTIGGRIGGLLELPRRNVDEGHDRAAFNYVSDRKRVRTV